MSNEDKIKDMLNGINAMAGIVEKSLETLPDLVRDMTKKLPKEEREKIEKQINELNIKGSIDNLNKQKENISAFSI